MVASKVARSADHHGVTRAAPPPCWTSSLWYRAHPLVPSGAANLAFALAAAGREHEFHPMAWLAALIAVFISTSGMRRRR